MYCTNLLNFLVKYVKSKINSSLADYLSPVTRNGIDTLSTEDFNIIR